YNIHKIYLEKLTDDILKKHKFIKFLKISNNSKIKNINWIVNLNKLYIFNESPYIQTCELDQEDINGLNLTELYVSNIHNINNVNWMSNLKILTIRGNSGIDQEGIKGLNLTVLAVSDNT